MTGTTVTGEEFDSGFVLCILISRPPRLRKFSFLRIVPLPTSLQPLLSS
jgi:hypothetical protein